MTVWGAAQQMIETFDTNKDGEIDYPEFLAMMRANNKDLQARTCLLIPSTSALQPFLGCPSKACMLVWGLDWATVLRVYCRDCARGRALPRRTHPPIFVRDRVVASQPPSQQGPPSSGPPRELPAVPAAAPAPAAAAELCAPCPQGFSLIAALERAWLGSA